MWAETDVVNLTLDTLEGKMMRRKHGYSIPDQQTAALCLVGAAVLLIPLFGLAPLIAVAIGIALGYETLNYFARAAA